MSSYLFPIKEAFVIFPFIAFVMTIPYMIFEYRKYGSIHKLRTLLIYALVLYLITAYFLIILPLPSLEEVAALKTPKVQLIPFTFVFDFLKNTSLVITEPSTYLKALAEPYIYQVLYNLVLLLPLGIYLRYYFKCSFSKCVLITFMVSLFFELTQLTGLYFIYPRSYRLFDVDDLLINTLGGIIGYFVEPIFTLILPSREKIDADAYNQGKDVSFFRRLFAFVLDQALIILIVLLLPFNLNKYLLVYFSYNVLSCIITKGFTLGRYFFRYKIMHNDSKGAKWYQYVFRFALEYSMFILVPKCLFNLFELVKLSHSILLISILSLCLVTYVIYVMLEIIRFIFKKRLLLYERISQTKNTSIILDKC